MKLKNKLEVEETLEVGVIPNATTSNFSVVFETAGLFQRRQVGSINKKNRMIIYQYLPANFLKCFCFVNVFNYQCKSKPNRFFC